MRGYIFNAITLVVFVALGLNCAVGTAESGHTAVSDQNRGANYFWSAVAHARDGNDQQVIEDATMAIELLPENPTMVVMMYNLRADSHAKLGNYEQAVLDCTEAIRLSDEHQIYKKNDSKRSDLYATLYNNRAWYTYHLKRDFDQAILDATKAVELKPEKAGHYDTRGWVYLGNGDYIHAMDDFAKALELDPDLENSRDGLQKCQELQTATPPTDLNDY